MLTDVRLHEFKNVSARSSLELDSTDVSWGLAIQRQGGADCETTGRPVHNSGGISMARRLVACFAATAMALVALTSCNDSDQSRGVGAQRSQPTALPTSPSSGPPPTSPPAWETRLDEDQEAAYEQALARWTELEGRAAPIWAVGKVTPIAEALFQEYYASPAWQLVLSRLRTYESVKVKVPKPPLVLWSKPGRVVLQPSGSRVTLLQCVDLTAQGTTQYGNPVAWPRPFEKPVVRRIVLERRSGRPWLITDNEPPVPDDFRRCESAGA